MGLERAHAQLVSQGEGLLVVGFGPLTLRRMVLYRDLAKEPWGVGFVAPYMMGSRKR